MLLPQKYLIPQAQKNSGLTNDAVVIDEDVLDVVIKSYCRESGVRNLQKHIEKVMRKGAYKIVNDGQKSVHISTNNLESFVGKPIFTRDKLYDVTPAGVVMGLAWTAYGGSTLFIESALIRSASTNKESFNDATATGKGAPKEGQLKLTGHLGDVMKESAAIGEYN